MYITLWSLYYIFIKSRPCNYPIFWISISFGRTRLRMIAKHHDGKAVYHLGHGNQTDVLGEGSQRRASKQRRHCGGISVTCQGTLDLFSGDFPVQAAGNHGRCIADGLSRRYQEDDAGQTGLLFQPAPAHQDDKCY